MEHTKELLSIHLSNLVPSPCNVRRHSAGQVEELAALIASQGLLHPLMVIEQVVGRGRARAVKFAVAAGERRRRALLLLQQQGRLPKSHEVLCELIPPERALEVSASRMSKSVRTSMNWRREPWSWSGSPTRWPMPCNGLQTKPSGSTWKSRPSPRDAGQSTRV